MGAFDLNINNQIKSVSGIRYLGLIASGNGITGFFQLLEAIARSRIDHTNISLLYTNKKLVNTEIFYDYFAHFFQKGDALLVEELVSFHDQHKLQLNMLVEEVKFFILFNINIPQA